MSSARRLNYLWGSCTLHDVVKKEAIGVGKNNSRLEDSHTPQERFRLESAPAPATAATAAAAAATASQSNKKS